MLDAKRKLSFAVIGGGSGGQGMAAYLSCLGHNVNLYNRTIEKLDRVLEQGFIEIEGIISGKARMNLVTDDIRQAVDGVDIIMVVVTADGHKKVASLLAPHLEKHQYVVLNPGRTGGALEFQNVIKKLNPYNLPCIIEAQTLLFACRLSGQGKINILGKKNKVKVAALPGKRIKDFIGTINHVIPEFEEVESVLHTSLNNIGAILHPIPTILNSARIESTKGDFFYYTEGVTPSVAKVIEKADHERMIIANAFDLEAVSLKEWLKYTYGAHGSNLCEALRNVKGYWGIKAPTSLDVRYIFEDIPQSLVPMSDMARYFGIKTPIIDSMINLASAIHNKDYNSIGRKASDMGLEGMNINEIKDYVMNGERHSRGGVVA